MPINERVIFDAAVEISDPKARQTFIEKACEGNAELFARVAALLKSHDEAGSFLEIPAVEFDGTLPETRVDQTLAHPPVSSVQSPTEIVRVLTPGIGDPDEDDSCDDDEAEHRVDLSFLKPSTKPGSIGTLGHYEILKVLGQGGFGIVFKAFDEKLHRHVAIKVMNPQMAATSPPRKRFLREARSAAAIRNENIVAVHSVEEEPLPYLVMEFIDGNTLQDKLNENGPLEVTEILYLGQQIAGGLAAAHALGLIHRDIKPGNILIEGAVEQKVKITDFGLARAADDASLTRSGVISGTPMYMAPEQATGQALDQRTDLFSLGSVLYQMACGRPPFRAPSTVAVLRRVTEDTARPLQEIVPELPDWLVTIVNKLLEKKPEDRFQSAKEVADLLGKCRTELQLNGVVSSIPLPQSSHLAPQDEPSSAAHSSTDRRSPNQPSSQPAIAQPSAAPQGSSRRSETDRLKLSWTLYGILLGIMVLLPILFGKQIGSYVNAWIWPAIPALPGTAVAGGLEFDGKDDFVSIDAVDWSYPQFTIEAFVTSAPDSDNGTIVQLGSGGDKLEWMSLYDDQQADPGKRLSGAAIQGKTPFANTSARLTAGVRQHRVLVFDGRYMHYYVNGIWQAKRFAEAHEGLMWKMKNLRIACDGSERRFFQGRIDQIRISRVARYDNNFAPITSVTSDDSTLALYNFDEGTGEVLKDASGNGHDGKIVGAKWVKSKSEDLTSRSDSPAPAISNLRSQMSNSSTGWHGWPADAPPPAIAPFNAEQAKHHQEAWAKYLDVPVDYTNSIGMKFVLVPPGEFMMGSSPEEIAQALGSAGDDKLWQETINSEGPRHKVVLTKATYIGVHEVTQGQFEQVMGRNPSRFGPMGVSKDVIADLDTSNFPVEKVSWDEATRFCMELSEVQSLAEDKAYRLLKDAEWEFACRAGTTTEYWIGENEQERLQTAWLYENSSERTHAVGELKENPFGLYDVHGNVWEWVQDAWDPTFYGQLQGQLAVDPVKPSIAGAPHVTRGGCWSSSITSSRSTSRCPETAAYAGTLIGFRVSLAVEAVRETLNRTVSSPASDGPN
jgi:serine/threonine protein kinase/formylglycine-generating enzyme required for sulfatase activity